MTATKHNQKINGIDLINWFHLGAQEVSSQRKYLNAINVFPVADGDTGTNLVTTLRAMVDHSIRISSFSDMMKNISESGIAHARGNSGIIFASYVNGLAISGASYEVVNLKEFSHIVHKAVDHLYQSVEDPVEGTMISVIRDWASFQFHNHERFETFQEMMSAAYQKAMESLEKTTSQLEVLSKNKVVDSGAAGFVRFLHGINRFFSGEGKTGDDEDWTMPGLTTAFFEEEENREATYCTEVFLSTESVDSNKSGDELSRELKTLLHPYGSSLIVSTAGDRTRVHIHTEEPATVVELLSPYGRLLEQKVDNMKWQEGVRKKRRHPVGILCDSIADLPREFLEEHQIFQLPLGILMNDTVYLDKQTMGLPELFRAIPKAETYPTSSQPEPSRVKAMLEQALELYESLIIITVSSKMSGTYQAIAKEVHDMDLLGKPVTVIDALTNSGAEGLLVKRAAELLDQGLSYDEVVEDIETSRRKTKIYVCLDTIEYMAKGGRISNTVGKVGMKVGLRPIVTIDDGGNGVPLGMGFSRRSLTRQIMKRVRKINEAEGVAAYSIVHADNLELAEDYQRLLTQMTGKGPAYISEISSIVAIHSGPGSVAICLLEN